MRQYATSSNHALNHIHKSDMLLASSTLAKMHYIRIYTR